MVKMSFIINLLVTPFLINGSNKYPGFKYPETKKISVIDTLYGRIIVDDYRWLENFSDINVQEWVDAQNKMVQSYLEQLPQHAYLKKDLMNSDAMMMNRHHSRCSTESEYFIR